MRSRYQLSKVKIVQSISYPTLYEVYDFSMLIHAYSVYACLETMLFDIALNYSSLFLGSKVLFATIITHDTTNVLGTTNIFLSLKTQPYAMLPSKYQSISDQY